MTIEAINVSTGDLRWRKSSRSGQDASNGNCVEIAWRKSSRSGQDGSNGACVEIAHVGDAVLIRDSKAPGQGNLIVAPTAWLGLVHVSKM